MPQAQGPLTCGLQRVEVLGRDTSIVCTHPACQSATLRAIIRPEERVDGGSGTVGSPCGRKRCSSSRRGRRSASR